jgi:hypothetical protein
MAKRRTCLVRGDFGSPWQGNLASIISQLQVDYELGDMLKSTFTTNLWNCLVLYESAHPLSNFLATCLQVKSLNLLMRSIHRELRKSLISLIRCQFNSLSFIDNPVTCHPGRFKFYQPLKFPSLSTICFGFHSLQLFQLFVLISLAVATNLHLRSPFFEWILGD